MEQKNKFFKIIWTKTIPRKNLFLFLGTLILVLFLSKKFFYYKQLGYSIIPNTTDILDEKNYIWAAKSFLRTGIPTAWSNLAVYKKTKETNSSLSLNGLSIFSNGEKPSLKNVKKFNYPITAVYEENIGKGKEHILIVQPFLDHSFFSGIVYGFKTPNSISSFKEVKVEDYRMVAIIISFITGILFFICASLYYGLFTGIFSFFVYSTCFVYILSSRYALIENLIVPCVLAILVFLKLSTLVNNRWLKRIFLILAGTSGGISVLLKESGVASLIMGLLILIESKKEKNVKDILFFLIPGLLVGSSFYIYSFLLNPKLYLAVLAENAGRGFFGSLNFLYSFYRLHFSNFPQEGWWIFGFISLFYLLIREYSKYQELTVGFLTFLFTFLFFGGINYPWYSLVFVPFLVIGTGIFLKELFSNPGLDKLTLFFLFPFSSSLFWGHSVFRDSHHNILVYRLSLIIFLALSLIIYLQKKFRFLKTLYILILLILLYEIYKWNLYGFEYVIAHWEKLPVLFSWMYRF